MDTDKKSEIDKIQADAKLMHYAAMTRRPDVIIQNYVQKLQNRLGDIYHDVW